ncbi:MAG: C-GCAxxG-C-C family (seleno)protein [Butyricicoccaceae bacterium]
MLKEKATEFYKRGYNCAETVVRAANEVYGLGLSDSEMKLMAGFGAGMGCGQVCGALSGAIAAISAKLVETKAHDCPELGKTCTDMVRGFKLRLKDTQCKNLKAMYFNQENRCLKTVLEACDALEEIMG